MGGTDEPTNLVEVTVTQHAMFHYCNYQLWGNIEDYVAFRGLCGQISEAEFLMEKFKTFGKIGSDRLQEKLKDPEYRAQYIEKCKQGFENSPHKEEMIKRTKENQPKAIEAARTPEAREKQKQKLKEIRHQQGERNSQYGKVWIYSLERKESIKINKDDPIPDGWCLGRKINFNSHLEKERKKEEKKKEAKANKVKQREQKVQLYTEWYEIYQQNSFKDFCLITGYSKSQQNLCAKFSVFVEDYQPRCTNKKPDP